MSLVTWLRDFRELHAKAKQGGLSAEERIAYRERREELARALLAAQKLALRPGETPRQALRVPRAMQVDLTWQKGSFRALTLDLSAGGFATLLAKAPATGEEVYFVLKLPGGQELAGKARVVDVRAQAASVRVAMAFKDLTGSELERLEMAVFDAVLDQLPA
jgi:hypothetical protein